MMDREYEDDDVVAELPDMDADEDEKVPDHSARTGSDSLSEKNARTLIDARDRMAGFWPLPPLPAGLRAPGRIGWLLNVVGTVVQDPVLRRPVSAVDLYFLSGDDLGCDFRATLFHRPYFYIRCSAGKEVEIESALRRDFGDVLCSIQRTELEDLDMLNHLATRARRMFLRVETFTTDELVRIRGHLLPYTQSDAKRNSRPGRATHATPGVALPMSDRGRGTDPYESIRELREYDVSYVTRVCIDCQVRCGFWYRVQQPSSAGVSPVLNLLSELVERANPTVLAYDIECTKAPLKFPDPFADDEIMMISWVVDGRGFLGVNRQIVSEDIYSFTYAPKIEFESDFTVFNEEDEASLLRRFLAEARAAQPRVFVTYNGDAFDWHFVQIRANRLGISILDEIGMSYSTVRGTCRGRSAIHMDCIHWVNRDSYLPQGSRGLKAVTRALLGYEPHELDPEEMLGAARSRPQELAAYSVSDAVATYQLYMKYVQPFIFSLCNILPFGPEDVLRKGSGTLCESLLMCEAHTRAIVAPNKFSTGSGQRTFQHRLLEEETYIGGHVEALQSGIYRADLPIPFRIDRAAIQELQYRLDDFLRFAIEEEHHTSLDEVADYEQVRAALCDRLERLAQEPHREECPLILHLDVGAMYPNIILTNRLQPHACVTREICAACDFNGTSDCRRKMQWVWRGEHYPATAGEVESIRASVLTSLRARRLRGENLSEETAQAMFKKRLRDYCLRVHKRTLETTVQTREAWICQRENPFYVDTVRAFRDRRYEYKRLLKRWRKALAESNGTSTEARSMCILYDSMQMAHKCILNSFYGYVMRKAARWYSMEMAGVVTHTGANIIRLAREWIEQIGLPLELDTDGIWCAVPASFPNELVFHTRDGREIQVSFICTVLNTKVAAQYTNRQYQDWSPSDNAYTQRSEFSIFFEIDGPYRAMVLPASREEGKSIKKRYAVFHEDGSIAEIKGFELKRRGELKLIKVLQSEIFERFLDGCTLAECYAAVGETANRWLDVLESHGGLLSDAELMELVAEQTHMSKPLADYLRSGQKSSAITCAKRIQEFLGAQMVRDKGLACRYVIARYPLGTQITERAIPVQIFSAESDLRQMYLRKWLREPIFAFRELLDWEYYRGRLANTIQRIISIPAACQGVLNPVPRIDHPDWLQRRLREQASVQKQTTLTSFFGSSRPTAGDMEDLGQTFSERRTHVLPISNSESNPSVLENVPCHSERGSREHLIRESPDSVFPASSVAADNSATGQARVLSTGCLSYRRWLDDFARPRWLTWLRQRRCRRKHLTGDSLRPRLSGLAVDHADLTGPLHLLSICSTDVPQTCRLWLQTTRGRVVAIPVRVPRRLFILYRQVPVDALGQPAEHAQRWTWCMDGSAVHEITVDDPSITEAQLSVIARNAIHLQAGYLAGVFGVHVSPVLHIAALLGNRCTFKEHVMRQSLRALQTGGIQLADLEAAPSRKGTDVVSLPFVLLSGNRANDRSGRGVWTLRSADKLLVFLVGSFWSESEAQAALCHALPDAAGNPKSEFQQLANVVARAQVVLCRNWNHAFRALGLSLADRFPTKIQNHILLVQAAFSVEVMRRRVPALNDYPLGMMPYVPTDSLYQPTGWELGAMRRALARTEEMLDHLPLRMQLSAFGRLPLCNLGRDLVAETIDVSVARMQLERYWPLDWPWKHLRIAADAEDPLEPFSWPEVSVRGAYMGISIDIEIQDLPLVALLQAEALYGVDGAQLPPGSFLAEILRPLAQEWAELEGDVNQTAAILTSHLHRWVIRGPAGFANRLLCRELLDLVRRAFDNLMETLEGMNATVVYATPFRMILCTHRMHVEEAKAYCKFLLESCQAKPMFRRLIFAPVLRYMSALLWHDLENHCALVIPDTPDTLFPSTTTSPLPGRIESRWTFVQNWGASATHRFVHILEKIITSLVHTAERGNGLRARYATATGVVGVQQAAESMPLIIADEIFELVNQLMQDKGFEVAEHASDWLLRLSTLHGPWREALLPIEHALSKLLHKSRFANKSNAEASPRIVLDNILCQRCLAVNVVVLRPDDPWQTSRSTLCRLCADELDRAAIRQRTGERLNTLLRAYLLQDSVCDRCGTVQDRLLGEQCECSGKCISARMKPAATESTLSRLLAVWSLDKDK
jgi:DNA polymerase epsilon subunit 1